MSLLRRVRDLESKSMQGRCLECGTLIHWVASIEELERVREAVESGRPHCGWCAHHMLHNTAVMQQAILDSFEAKAG